MANEFIVRRSRDKRKKICTNCGERFDSDSRRYSLTAGYSHKTWIICWACAFWKFPVAAKKMTKLADENWVSDKYKENE
jgi:hypothetical protein